MNILEREKMNPPGNPSTANTPAVQHPNGDRIGRPLRAFRGGTNITTAMSAPTDPDLHCEYVDKAPRAEFIVRAPDGVTQFTIHYGRWVTGKEFGAVGTGLSGWLEVGTKVCSGATAGELFSVEFDTKTDLVAIYIDTLTGVATENFRMWFRGIP